MLPSSSIFSKAKPRARQLRAAFFLRTCFRGKSRPARNAAYPELLDKKRGSKWEQSAMTELKERPLFPGGRKNDRGNGLQLPRGEIEPRSRRYHQSIPRPANYSWIDGASAVGRIPRYHGRSRGDGDWWAEDRRRSPSGVHDFVAF